MARFSTESCFVVIEAGRVTDNIPYEVFYVGESDEEVAQARAEAEAAAVPAEGFGVRVTYRVVSLAMFFSLCSTPIIIGESR